MSAVGQTPPGSPLHSHESCSQKNGHQKGATDCKVYALIVVSSFLIAIGITLVGIAVLSAEVSIASGLLATTGITALVLGIFLVPQRASKKPLLTTFKKPQPVFVPGQPIGVRRPGNNCWINAFFQLICNVKKYQEAIERLDPDVDEAVAPLIAEYNKLQSERETPSTASANTQTIREWLHNSLDRPNFGRSARTQADSWDFADHFLKVTDQRLPGMRVTEDGEHFEEFYTAGYAFELDPNRMAAGNTMKQHISANFFEMFIDDHVEIKNLLSPPEHFTVHFLNQKPTPIRLNDAMELTFTEEEFGEEATYRCDGFVHHRGTSHSCGHFVAYIFREGSWWLVNDTKVSQVSQDEVMRKLRTAYIVHYEKVEERISEDL